MKRILINLSLIALTAASCTQTDLIENRAGMTGMIDYSLYAGRGTRAIEADNANFKQFKIYAYKNIGGTFSPHYDETVKKLGTEWAGVRPQRWPEGTDDYLNFYAYSDESDNMGTYTKAEGVDGPASFEYTVPTDATAQKDLLVAGAFEQTARTNQEQLKLDFKHALTQIAFKVKSASPSFDVLVEKVELIGVNSKATFTYEKVPTTQGTVGAWSAADTPESYAMTVSNNTVPIDVNPVELTSNDGNLMMIPTTTPDNVKIRVTYKLDGDTEELVKEIAISEETKTDGAKAITSWKQGKKITYNLTLVGKANQIIFGDATMEEGWDAATEEKADLEAKEVFGVSILNIGGAQNETGTVLTINDNRATPGDFKLESNADWLLLSETAGDFVNAGKELTSATTRAMATQKTVYVYTKLNTTNAKRSATITLTRTGCDPVILDITQKAFAINDPLSASEITAREAKGTYTFNVNVPLGVTYTLTSDKDYITLGESETEGSATPLTITSNGAEKTIHAFAATNISSVARNAVISFALSAEQVNIPVDGRNTITVKQAKETVWVNYKDDFSAIAKPVIWAQTNIYFDGTKLTFKVSGASDSEKRYSGVYMGRGSLVVIDAAEWADSEDKGVVNSHILYQPVEYSAPTFKSPTELPRNVKVITDLQNTSFSSVAAGNHMPSNGIGDICRYMSENGLAPDGRKWRIPTQKEAESLGFSTHSTKTTGTLGAVEKNGTRVMSNSVTFGSVVFPIAGNRQSTWSLSQQDDQLQSWLGGFGNDLEVGEGGWPKLFQNWVGAKTTPTIQSRVISDLSLTPIRCVVDQD